MVVFTKMKTPLDDDMEYFSDQLSRLYRMLNLAPPTFHGRELLSSIPGRTRWLIETKIKGNTIEPPTETMVYARRYPSWEIGMVMAMEEALARICETYSKEIFDLGTPFHLFGRRNSEGCPMRTPGNRAMVPWIEVQLEDMEGHVYNLEHLLLAEMDTMDNAKNLLQERQEKIEQLEDIVQKLKDKFLNGLKGELKIPLSIAYVPSYRALLDQAITLDNNIRKEENRKRKFNNDKTHTEPFHKRHHSSEGNGNGSNSNGHRHNGGNKGNHSNGHHNGGNGHHHGGNGHHNGSNGNHNGGNGNHNGGNGHQNGGNGQHRFNSGTKRDLLHITCFKCEKTGHFANDCPENKQDDAANPNPFQKGHVNHINVEEVMGTFPLNSFTALDFI
jgi:hypothetical protein